MKRIIFSWLSCCLAILVSAQPVKNYHSLDPAQPIVFGGSYIVYSGDTVTLGPKAFFIDGHLSDAETAKYPFVFNSVNKAAEKLTDGSESAPMVLYLAPWVYWIDDPDDPAIRTGENGLPPYGLVIPCEWLHFKGLNNNPQNVVLACNRGQTIGARGNFTMFRFLGQGTGSENITFGNYCSVDLEYPLLPRLSRKKRAPAIVQAQLIHCNGDKIVARNTRFISRLNLCPFTGGKRVLFDRCHFESTDDALCGTGVYLNCTLDVYGSKPFYRTTGTGAVFLNCDIRSFTSGEQFFTKANGQLAIVDSRIKTEPGTYVGWQDVVPAETRNYQYGVTQNGKPLLISRNDRASTVDMAGDPVLHAYRFVYQGRPVYNTYNLLMGDDDWDPMHLKTTVIAAEKAGGTHYTKIPVQLLLSPTGTRIETNKDPVKLTAKLVRFGNYDAPGEQLTWSVAPPNRSLVRLNVSKDGMSCTVIPTNSLDETREVIVKATTASGMEAASKLIVAPPILPAPQLKSAPVISVADGKLHVSYALDSRFRDQSLVNWYRCRDAACSDPVEVADSRFDTPLVDYTLSAADAGYYLAASVQPKHIRSDAGTKVWAVMQRPVSAKDITAPPNLLYTDFKNAATKNQPRVLPGFWTLGPLDIATNEQRFAVDNTKDAWYMGEGSDGAAGMTGLLQGRSAEMRYTPDGENFGDMKLAMHVAPFKTAGQGFSVAPLYMDVLIKLDTKTMTGYGLRFIRTTKHHDAVDCYFVKYENGKAQAISEPVTTSAFRTLCTIEMEVQGDKISATVSTNAGEHPAAGKEQVLPTVDISAQVTPNQSGGFGIEYNGGSPTMIKDVKLEWK